jgi:uncharacterized phage-associated protein
LGSFGDDPFDTEHYSSIQSKRRDRQEQGLDESVKIAKVAMIAFEFKPEKFASSVAYLVSRRPGLTKKQLCKLLYLADKAHLLKYGRTITGDRYFALEQGPIPTKGLDAMNLRGDRRNIEALLRFGKLSGWEFRLSEAPDLKPLSRSDISVLDQISDEFGDFQAWQLEKITHEEPAYKRAKPNGPMSFELFFEGHPDSDVLKSILLEEDSEQRGAEVVYR